MFPSRLSAVALLTCLLTACSMMPEQGAPREQLNGRMIFPSVTALPPTARATVTVLPANARSDEDAVAQGTFPARTGGEIPFSLDVLKARINEGSEYLVLAQVIDHGTVWYSNLSTPFRFSFVAEPGDIVIELRPEKR